MLFFIFYFPPVGRCVAQIC